jgi:hypothetical protein
VNGLLQLYRTDSQKKYSTDEQIEALHELVLLSLKQANSHPPNHFDIWMAKQAVTYFIGYGSDHVIRLTTGKLLPDRFGAEHRIYSYLIKDSKSALTLYRRVQAFPLSANPPREVMNTILDILFAALNGVESKEAIRSFADAEFIKQALPIYYNQSPC